MGINEIAGFIQNITLDKVPGEAVKATKIPILDCLGVAVAGSAEEASRIMQGYLAECGGQPEAGLIGAGLKTSAAQAAWGNGTTAHILDFDDYYLPYHPTVAILPAVLALAEKHQLSGQEVILAYLTGFEVEASIAAVMGRAHYEKGWHSTPLLGSLGAAAAAAKLLRLDQTEIRMALGIASSLSGGLRKNFGTMTKSLHAGNAARNGVVAAELAHKGFTSDNNILEGSLGFMDILGSLPGGDPSRVGQELGKQYFISTVGVSLKPYPSCAGTHWAIEAAIELKKELGGRVKGIASIECITGPEVPRILIHSRPTRPLEAKFSLEYCIAVSLLDGSAQLKQFSDGRILNPDVQQLLKVVTYSHPPRMGSGLGDEPCEMLVTLKDGVTFLKKEKKPKGTPENPLTQEEAAQKYLGCVEGRMPSKSARQAVEQIFKLEKVQDISKLMNIFTFLK